MTDSRAEPTEDELTVLARARAGLSPSRADQDRVRESMRAALALQGAASGTPIAAASAASRWLPRLLVASAIAVSSGAVGYWAGYRAGSRESRLVAPAHQAPVAASATSSGSAAPSGGPEAPPPVTSETRHAGGLARGIRSDPTRSSAGGGRASAAESLEKELSALRGVERALRDGQPSLALALLQELDRTVPDGKLGEEREATATIARCALGAVPFGVDLGEDFAARYPGSVYRKRVEEACAEASRSK